MNLMRLMSDSSYHPQPVARSFAPGSVQLRPCAHFPFSRTRTEHTGCDAGLRGCSDGFSRSQGKSSLRSADEGSHHLRGIDLALTKCHLKDGKDLHCFLWGNWVTGTHLGGCRENPGTSCEPLHFTLAR